MDPITLGLLMAVGAGGAAAVARWRKRRGGRARPSTARAARGREERAARDEADERAVRVGDVLLHLGDEYWLAGELALMREGAAALRLFSAPEKGADRWVALTRDGESLYVLHPDAALAALGWPGVEVPLQGLMLRPVEQGACAVSPGGEVPDGWEGVGRYAVFRAMERVAVVVEQGSRRLSLSGKSVPRRLVEKLG